MVWKYHSLFNRLHIEGHLVVPSLGRYVKASKTFGYIFLREWKSSFLWDKWLVSHMLAHMKA